MFGLSVPPCWTANKMALASRAARVSLRTSMHPMQACLNTQKGRGLMRRSMSSSSDGHGPKSTSDTPWIVGSAVIFGPLAIYLLRPANKSAHGHGHDDVHHEKEEHKSSSDSEVMTSDEGTDLSSEDVNASTQEGLDSDSLKDPQSAEATEGGADQDEAALAKEDAPVRG